MSHPTAPAHGRALRRRRKHQRQAVIFGALVLSLVVAGVGSAAVFQGTIDSPFTREFTTPPVEEAAAVGPVPCPTDGALPVPYGEIIVQVLNASERGGLARTVADQLAERGFGISAVGNYPSGPQAVTARIAFGAAGVDAAHTVAAHFELPILVLDGRQDATVDVALGEDFAELIDAASIPLDPNVPLAPPPGCRPLAEITPSTPSPAPESPAVEGDPAPQDEEVVRG